MACWFCGGDADVLTAGEIAERLETSPKLVQRWIYLGELVAEHVAVGPGPCWLVQGADFWQFLERHPPWLVRLAGGDPKLASRQQAAERRTARALGGVMQPTNRPNVFDNFVHRRGGPHARKAVYECRRCRARLRAVYTGGMPDLGRVRERLARHIELCSKAA
jgi:hypothetical protein